MPVPILRVPTRFLIHRACEGITQLMHSHPSQRVRDAELLALRRNLQHHIVVLANDIGERHVRKHDSLTRAKDYISDQFRSLDLQVRTQPYECDGTTVENVWAEIPGRIHPEEIVIFGAHYDTIPGSPGANDNGSGVAAVLELARMARGFPFARTVQFVLFPNEETPYFHSELMGSHQYARRLHDEHSDVFAMVSIEEIGYFNDKSGSQHHPESIARMYPHTGNFIAFASNVESTPLLRRCVDVFRKNSPVPVEGLSAPEEIPGVSWSDQWSFWQHGYEAVMVTDTAPYRYPWYHAPQDTPDKLDYRRFTYVVFGLRGLMFDLATVGTDEVSSLTDMRQ